MLWLVGTLAVAVGVQSETQLAVDYIIGLATNYIYLQVDNTQKQQQQKETTACTVAMHRLNSVTLCNQNRHGRSCDVQSSRTRHC